MKATLLFCLLGIAVCVIPEGNAESPPYYPTCGPNEEFTGCSHPCPPVCGQPPPEWCTKNCVVTKCQCKEGYIRSGSADGPCIPLSECESKLQNAV
uniref:TIL domain-containing protein n=1 Tax=Ornithodoros turicata TaxID=34597 RepID=A0A2R5LFJ5_9ACAR